MPHSSSKAIIEDCQYLTVTNLARKGVLRAGCCWTCETKWPSGRVASMEIAFTGEVGGLALDLAFQVAERGKSPVHHSQRIDLACEASKVGGRRWWLVCPRCQTRRRTLFLPPREVQFACRVCHDMRYRSTLRSKSQRRWCREVMGAI